MTENLILTLSNYANIEEIYNVLSDNGVSEYSTNVDELCDIIILQFNNLEIKEEAIIALNI